MQLVNLKNNLNTGIYKFMIKKTIWLTGALSFFILFFINKEVGMLYGCSLIVLFSSVMERNRMWAFLPALLVSWIWVYIGRGLYSGYSDVFSYSFMGVSLFPIIAWPTILFLSYLGLYPRIKANSWWNKWLKMSVIYSVGIILFEYWGYNFAGVHVCCMALSRIHGRCQWSRAQIKPKPRCANR